MKYLSSYFFTYLILYYHTHTTKSPFLYGIWSFSDFFNAIIKSAIIFTPILILARRFVIKFIPEERSAIEEEKETILTIKGEYKLDVLKIYKSDLICITKSQNYVEVFFYSEWSFKLKN